MPCAFVTHTRTHILQFVCCLSSCVPSGIAFQCLSVWPGCDSAMDIMQAQPICDIAHKRDRSSLHLDGDVKMIQVSNSTTFTFGVFTVKVAKMHRFPSSCLSLPV